MEVILTRDVERIGKAGQIIKAKDGFARNFLIPNKLAVPVNSVNLKKLEDDKKHADQKQQKDKEQALELKNKLDKVSLTLPVLTKDDDKLYGSISVQDIISELKDEGIEIDKNKIILDEPAKSLGIYEVTVKLHPEVITKIKVWIVKK
ncbi:MAG: 50S ribosomal protein L9 [Candidatus Omnitrophica bacterium]|jgi:large subunit ribosomal protein L9|nr:50S ribosomal protein L9 [Candidatus Omnitrophota bacterium]